MNYAKSGSNIYLFSSLQSGNDLGVILLHLGESALEALLLSAQSVIESSALASKLGSASSTSNTKLSTESSDLLFSSTSGGNSIAKGSAGSIELAGQESDSVFSVANSVVEAVNLSAESGVLAGKGVGSENSSISGTGGTGQIGSQSTDSSSQTSDSSSALVFLGQFLVVSLVNLSQGNIVFTVTTIGSQDGILVLGAQVIEDAVVEGRLSSQAGLSAGSTSSVGLGNSELARRESRQGDILGLGSEQASSEVADSESSAFVGKAQTSHSVTR